VALLRLKIKKRFKDEFGRTENAMQVEARQVMLANACFGSKNKNQNKEII
jgi:hypothetical protein